MQLVEVLLLLGGPFGPEDGGVQVVVVPNIHSCLPFAALLACPVGHVVLLRHLLRDAAPLADLGILLQVLQYFVFLRTPRSSLGHIKIFIMGPLQ